MVPESDLTAYKREDQQKLYTHCSAFDCSNCPALGQLDAHGTSTIGTARTLQPFNPLKDYAGHTSTAQVLWRKSHTHGLSHSGVTTMLSSLSAPVPTPEPAGAPKSPTVSLPSSQLLCSRSQINSSISSSCARDPQGCPAFIGLLAKNAGTRDDRMRRIGARQHFSAAQTTRQVAGEAPTGGSPVQCSRSTRPAVRPTHTPRRTHPRVRRKIQKHSCQAVATATHMTRSANASRHDDCPSTAVSAVHALQACTRPPPPPHAPHAG